MRLLVLLVLLVVCGPAAPVWAGDWRWPVDGPPTVSRPFVAPAHRYAAGHRGADLAAAPGVPVRAAGDGWVSYAGLVAGRGVVVVVHGPLRTTYEPVSPLVEVGSLVAAGEVVGVLETGHLGCPVLACLHWGLRRGDDYLDPVRLVAPGPVRLLPVEGSVAALRTGQASALRAGPPTGGGSAARLPGEARDAEGGAPVPLAAAGDRPASVRAPASRTSPSTDVGLTAAAAASVLGAASVLTARRRRR